MTILQAVDAAKNQPDFRNRVEFYMVKAAISVTTEASGTAFHIQRQSLAEQILASAESHVTRFALGVITNPTILGYASHSVVPDGDIEFVVNSIYNSYLDL